MIYTMQERAANWHTAAFPGRVPQDVIEKLFEEVGEVARADIGRREHRLGRGVVADELVDAFTCLLVLAQYEGINLIERGWQHIKALEERARD